MSLVRYKILKIDILQIPIIIATTFQKDFNFFLKIFYDPGNQTINKDRRRHPLGCPL